MRLFNAHRLVQLRTFPPKEVLNAIPKSEQWRYKVTPDVVKYVKDTGLNNDPHRADEFQRVIRDPEHYFAFPQNVPLESRQQIYLPEIVLTLIRTPHLPPKYASFWVPLWFNKLDMKDYLGRVYGVNVLHVRSYVQQQKVYREQVASRGYKGYRPGRLLRPMSKKKMTVELEDPFVWPEEVDDYSPWEKDSYHAMQKERDDRQDAYANEDKQANEKHREIMAEQARALLERKQAWKPTWQSFSVDAQASQRSNLPP